MGIHNKIIFQDNAITMARKEYTALEKNLIYMVLGQLNEDKTNKFYYISIQDIMDKTGKKNSYNDYKVAADKMVSRTIIIPKEYSKSGNRLAIAFFASCEYMEKEGMIEIELSDKIKPYLFDLKNNFTTFQLNLALTIKSRFAKDMYELLSQYKDTGVFSIEIEKLKNILGLIDLKTGAEQYTKWSGFEQYVLKQAKKEINKNTDIQFSYKPIKRGRRFHSIIFYIKYTPYQMAIDYKDADTLLFSKLVNKYGLSKNQSQKVINNYNEKEINQKLYDINLMRVNNQIKTVIGAYTAKIFNV